MLGMANKIRLNKAITDFESYYTNFNLLYHSMSLSKQKHDEGFSQLKILSDIVDGLWDALKIEMDEEEKRSYMDKIVSITKRIYQKEPEEKDKDILFKKPELHDFKGTPLVQKRFTEQDLL